MEDLFKKIVYTSVDFFSTAAEKLEKTIDDLIEKGNISDIEGKKMVDDFLKNAEAKKEAYEARMKEMFGDLGDKFRFSSKEEVDALKQKIKDLEDQLKAQTGGTDTETGGKEA